MRIEELLLQNVRGEKEVDFYVPVNVTFKDNDEKYKELFYYRMINLESSFVEVSINSVTNKIVNITLVSVNSIKEMENICFKYPKEYGNPIINMNSFKEEHIVTDHVDFNVFSCEKKIYVLQEAIAVCKQLVMSYVSLLLDGKNNIIGFIFEGFSDDEWKEVKNGIL